MHRIVEEAIEMSVSTLLRDSLQHTNDELSGQLEIARLMIDRPEQSRRGCPPIDLFLSGTSKHLHAVDAVLLPPARRSGEDGQELVHDYLHVARELEVVLAHVKAHEYGSAYETSFEWGDVWADVDTAFDDQRRHEAQVADRLTETLEAEEVEELAGRLDSVERRAPSRPHPYLPHTGAGGAVARGVMRLADSAWDAIEGRYTSEPAPRPKKKPGLLGQYLLADPRFEEEESEREVPRQ